MFNLTNKRVLVAGSHGLIGRHIVKTLENLNCKVKCADISNKDDPLNFLNKTTVKITTANFKPDAFINCTYPPNHVEHFKIFSNCTQILSDYFKERNFEINGVVEDYSIINFSSIYGVTCPDYSSIKNTTMYMHPNYGFIKAGIIQMSKLMAAQYAKYGIRVNCISPGAVVDNQPAAFIKRYNERCPMNRMCFVEDIMSTVVYLLSNSSSFVTGHNILIDGGYSLV